MSWSSLGLESLLKWNVSVIVTMLLEDVADFVSHRKVLAEYDCEFAAKNETF